MVSGHGWIWCHFFFALWMKSWSVFGHANGWLLSGTSKVAAWNMPHVRVIFLPATRLCNHDAKLFFFGTLLEHLREQKTEKKKLFFVWTSRVTVYTCFIMFHISWPIYHISLYGISWSYIMSHVSYIHIQIQVSVYGTTWYNLAGLGLWYLYHHWHCHCAFTATKNGKRLMFTTQEWWRLVSYGKERFPQWSFQLCQLCQFMEGNETQSWSFSNRPGIWPELVLDCWTTIDKCRLKIGPNEKSEMSHLKFARKYLKNEFFNNW